MDLNNNANAALTLLPPPAQKPHPESKLKTHPEERQSDIYHYARDHSLDQTVEWLDANGIPTSSAALSRFLSWFGTRLQLECNEAALDEFHAAFGASQARLSPDELHQVGTQFFSQLALEKQDPKIWYLAQQIACLKANRDLQLQKYHDVVQARKEAIQKELDTAKDKGGLSPETIEKIERELNLF